MPGWAWLLGWLGLALVVGLLVRLPGPAALDPDEHAAVVYFDRLVAGERLEEPLLSSPKPLLTVVYGLAWRVAHDWRLLEALAVAAFALAVLCLARAAGRLAGLAAAAATVVAVAGSGPFILQVARGNSIVFAFAAWAVALDALTRRPGAGSGGQPPPAAEPGAVAPAWGVAAAAVAAGALARAEGWLVLPLAAGYGLVAWRRGERRALLLLLPLAVPLVWLLHDWLLTGDPLYAAHVPERYTDLISGRKVIPPVEWLAQVARRYWADPVLLALAGVGVAWMLWRREWVWLAALGVVGVGVLALLGYEAWRGIYISFRYYDPPDLALRLAAAIGAARLATLLVRTPVAGRRARGMDGGWGPAAPPGPARTPAKGTVPVLAGMGAVAGAVLLVGWACWPLAPGDPEVDATLDLGSRLSANTATAVTVLRPVAAGPNTVVTASGGQRVRVAVELDLPLGRVRDLFLTGRAGPLDRALAGSAAVFHDAAGDGGVPPLGALSVTMPTRIGTVQVVPLHVDPARGLYVLRVEEPGG